MTTPPKEQNTVIEPRVDVAMDLADIAAGRAIHQGNFIQVNGRTYGVKQGNLLYPVEGDGFHQLDRQAFKALQAYNTYGGDTEAARRFIENSPISVEQAQAALVAWQAGGRRRR